MNTSRSATLGAALCGLAGVPTLIASFAVNPGPPSGLTTAGLVAFGEAHMTAIRMGGWMQATGTLLCVLFALAIVRLANAGATYAGLLTLFGCAVLMCVGLAEVTCYMGATSGDPTTLAVINNLIPALQHAYPIVAAPMVFLPLGAVILTSGILPRTAGYLALALGTVFAALGLVGVLAPVQGAVDALSALQGFWWLAAAVILLVRALRREAPASHGSRPVADP